MIKKILISTIVLLLLVLVFVAIYKGIGKISSVENIKLANENLDKNIEEASRVTTVAFKQKLDEQGKQHDSLSKVKQEYEDMLMYSSEEEVAKAKTSQTYEISFIWVKLGNYAKEQGLGAKFDLTESSKGTPNMKDIKFTLNGDYANIIEFMYNIENDEVFDFKIEDFSMTSGQAEFVVKDLSVTGIENIQTNESTSPAQSNTTNTTRQTNTTNTTNTTKQ